MEKEMTCEKFVEYLEEKYMKKPNADIDKKEVCEDLEQIPVTTILNCSRGRKNDIT